MNINIYTVFTLQRWKNKQQNSSQQKSNSSQTHVFYNISNFKKMFKAIFFLVWITTTYYIINYH